MKNDIKTVYLDIRGGQHATKSDAAKANRLIMASYNMIDVIDWEDFGVGSLLPRCESDGGIDEHGKAIIEYARAMVAIHGMKDGAK